MSFHIELIVADRGWILEKIAREIQQRCPLEWEVRISTKASAWADLHYFIPYSKQPETKRALSACFFTHREDVEPARSNFLRQAQRADYCVAMSDKYARLLRKQGIEDVWTIETGVDLEAFDVRLQVGVVGRTYHTGRKGEDLVAECMDLKNIEFLFTGSGWPGASVQLSDSELPGFFNKLDYLLVPSRIEGGPVPLMEALASGCQVIAPSDIGFVEKFPHIPFENGNADSLRGVLKGLLNDRQSLRASVSEYSWSRFGEQHVELFREIAAQHGFSAVERQPVEVSLKKVYLLCHGIEAGYRGGPTTRMGIIAAFMREQGLEVEFLAKASELSGTDTAGAIVHVFNSWPLHFASKQLIEARKRGYRTVYSPIALNLEDIHYFSHVMPERATARAKGTATTEVSLQRSAPDYQAQAELMPMEGVAGHFGSLRTSTASADGVLLLSHYEESFLRRLGCRQTQQQVIDNGVDSQVMAGAEGELFKGKYNLDRYVLVVGRVEPRKNQAAIAAALADSDLKLVFVGQAIDKKYREAFQRCSGPNVLHIDHLEDRELLASAYRGATVFLMASWSEGAPLAALEAAAAGTPLVLSCMASEMEYFGDDALYVHPADMRDIAAQVQLAAQDTERQSADRRRATSAKYQPRFSARRHAQQTLDFYRAVLTGDAGSTQGNSSAPVSATCDGTCLSEVVASCRQRGETIKLHLGCGGERLVEFINVDLYPALEGVQDQSRSGCVADVFEDIRALGLPHDSVDEIYSSHVVEHFVRWEACEMFNAWHKMLKPGGALVIEMPSFWRCVAWLMHPSAKKRKLALPQFYGNQWDKLDFETHRYVWGAKEVRKQLKLIGFKSVKVNHRTRTHHRGRDMRVVAMK